MANDRLDTLRTLIQEVQDYDNDRSESFELGVSAAVNRYLHSGDDGIDLAKSASAMTAINGDFASGIAYAVAAILSTNN